MSFDAERVRWTDTMGSYVVDPLGNNFGVITPVEGTQEIQVPGLVSGEPRTFELIWKNLKPVDCEDSTSNCTGNILEDYDENDDPNYELAYRGDDECQGMGPDPVSPALFTTPTPGTSWYVNGSQTIKTTDVNRPCANSFGQNTLRRFNPVVLAAVNLPNGTSYEFKYNIYGEISRITYPTGAYERFRYGAIPLVGGDLNSAYAQANRGVRERWVSFDGTTEAQHWQYKAGTLGVNGDGLVPYAVVTTAPDGTKTQSISLRHEEPRFGLDDPRDGLPVEERVYSSSCTATDIALTGCEEDMLRRTLTELIVAPPRTGGNARAVRDPRPARTVSILFEPGASGALATLTENTYDSNTDDLYLAHLNLTVSKQYNYKALTLSAGRSDSLATIAASFSSGDLARKMETDYLYHAHYKSRNINGLPTATRVYNGAGHLVAATQIEYDAPLPTGTIELTSWEDPGEAKRGLVTSTKACSAIVSDDCTAWIETRTQYDQFGNPVYQWDANQIAANHTGTQYATHTEYTDSTHDYKYAFPFRVTTPAPDPSNVTGSNTGFVTTSTYDLNTGLVLTITDANGQTTTMEYDDPLLRPTKVIPPGGKAQVVTEYCDGQGGSPCSGAIYVRTKTQVEASHWSVATKYLDKAGRSVQTEQQDSGGNIRVDTQYDSLGRVWKTSNPYRAGGTPVWTVNGYDELGRVTTVTTPDSALVGTAFGLNTVDTGGIPLGTMTLVTDQAGIKRLALTDAGGNLTDVWEIKSSDSDTVNVAFDTTTTLTGYRTRYFYDVLGKLHKVQQGSQNRYFAYDPMGRLIRAKNVEQETNTSLPSFTDPLTSNSAWAQAYTYDANGNLLVTTTARNATITNTYDALNRVTLRNYSGTMPDVEYRYDSVTHGLGKLASVSNGLVTTRFTEYSSVGELLKSQQEFDGVAAPYTFQYAYNMAGQMVSETYPSGRVVMNTFDSEGKNDSVSSRGNGHAPRIHANAFHYNDKGVLDRLRLGNGLWEGMTANNRFQTTQITLGTTSGGNDLLKLDYNYGSTANNGNVLNQTITVPTIGSATGFVATQDYTYDQLNRLATVAETQYGLTTPDWRQQFGYDRYGNRSMGTGSGQTFGRNTVETQELIGIDPQVSTVNNRITNRTGELYEFDASGNMTKDAMGNRSVYDIENHQTEYYYSINTGSTADAKYYYDGDGKRIKKVVGSQETRFIYDAAGKLAAEYTVCVTANPTPQTNYVTFDTLGSTRLVTNGAGQVVARHDYLPFGDEIYGLGGRTSAQGFAQPDTIRQRFTGYEKDTESGLDFAQARYYGKGLGRFTGVDPLLESAKIGIPQSWNRYSYCVNNPVNLIDPSGLDPTWAWIQLSNGYRQFNYFQDDQKLPADYHAYSGNFYRFDDGSIAWLGSRGLWGWLRSPDTAREARLKSEERSGSSLYLLQFSREFNKYAPALKQSMEIMFELDIALISNFSTIGRVGATKLGLEFSSRASNIRLAARVGSEGESIVRETYDIGEKTAVRIDGQLRIPDGLTKTTISEVKNVSSLSYTQQLRDYAAFARQNNLRFDLYVRDSTKLSGPLQQARDQGVIRIITFAW